MTRMFIFAQQVKQIIADGDKEIEIPEGAVISAAAADLIKEHKLRIKTTPPGAETPTAMRQTRKKLPDNKAVAQQTALKAPTAQSHKSNSAKRSGKQISEEALEAIANRVVERILELKGQKPSKPDATAVAATESQPAASDDDMIICRCEEITKGEIKNAIRNGMQTLNGIKRVTRAGMGLCQGQTCQRLVSQILAEELGLSLAEVEPTTARGPVRPLRLAVFANR
jgi:bacterioferritin-associated ferredoxin